MIWPPSRRTILAGAGAGFFAATMPARAAARRFKIFMVLGRGESDNEIGFKDYFARRNISVDYVVRSTGGDPARLPAIIDEIRAVRPDLIYSWGTPQTLGLVGPLNAPDPTVFINDIPVVFTFVAAPMDAGIVASLDRPGRNVTGTIHIAPVAVQLNAILAYRPIRRLGVVYNPAERNSLLNVGALRTEAEARGITLIEEAVPRDVTQKPSGDAVPERVANTARRGAEMLYVGPDTFIAFTHRRTLAEAALRARLPTFSATELIVRNDGAMMGLVSSSFAIGRFTAFKAAQILVDGMRPGDIPVETLKRFSLLINMPVARQLDCYPPLGLLDLAEVIEG